MDVLQKGSRRGCWLIPVDCISSPQERPVHGQPPHLVQSASFLNAGLIGFRLPFLQGIVDLIGVLCVFGVGRGLKTALKALADAEAKQTSSGIDILRQSFARYQHNSDQASNNANKSGSASSKAISRCVNCTPPGRGVETRLTAGGEGRMRREELKKTPVSINQIVACAIRVRCAGSGQTYSCAKSGSAEPE